jgi:uncharacterized membrane protein (UPF0127 family)
MKTIRVINKTSPLRKELKVKLCDRFLCRLAGLMFRRPLDEEEGIVFVNKRENRVDSAVHMLFMRMDLTIVWLDSKLNVVDKAMAKKWGMSFFPKQPASYVLELSTARFSEFHIGDVIEFG